jgi:hypothetical protein
MRQLVLVLFLVGCGGDDVSPDAAATVDAAITLDQATSCTLSRPYDKAGTACDNCATLHCCAAINTCYGTKSCDDDYTNCYLACGLFADADAGTSAVDSCVADCDKQYPAGQQLFVAAIGCVDQHCASECR